MDDLQRAKITRRTQRTQATKLWNKAQSLMEEELVDGKLHKLQVVLETYNAKIEQLQKLDEIIANKIVEEKALEAEIAETDDYITELREKRYQIQFFIKSKESTNSINGHESPAQNVSTPTNNNRSNHRLPKLSLPVFTGNPLKWQTFWDTFKTAIHSHFYLSDVHLKVFPSANSIEGLPLTESNYTQAIKILEERFGQPHKITNAHMQALIDLPSPSGSVVDLRRFYDSLENHICIECEEFAYISGLGPGDSSRHFEHFPPFFCQNKFLNNCTNSLLKSIDLPKNMSENGITESGVTKGHQIYRVVLTGGPCAGKTTSQARLSTFFENLGWKVFRVPEAATILLGGGVKFKDLTPEQSFRFQENLLKTIIQLENTFFDLAESCNQNCLVICDRGVMDPSIYLSKEEWQKLLKKNNWNNVKLRDERYNQVIHLVTAAKGAEEFYQLENNSTRSEGLALAKELDDKACQAWVGHPYFDVIGNSADFGDKVSRVITAMCVKIGIDIKDRLDKDSKKRKFLISKPPNFAKFPPYQDFDVQHDYLITAGGPQVRIRKRGQSGHYTYSHTVRLVVKDQMVERRKIISSRAYQVLLQQRDPTRSSIIKRRSCFAWRNQYFQLDVYCQPCNERCEGLSILETFTTKQGNDLPLPDFLEIEKEITDDKDYSMYNLSLDE